MKKQLIACAAFALLTACSGSKTTTAEADKFDYTVEQFADLQILRYRVPGFENLSLQQKELVYYLTEAALQGRDILFDQNGKYNEQSIGHPGLPGQNADAAVEEREKKYRLFVGTCQSGPFFIQKPFHWLC